MPGCLAIGICLPIAIVCLRNVLVASWRQARPHWHPAARVLARFGGCDGVNSAITQEIDRGTHTLRMGHSLLTPSWLLQESRYGLEVVHFSELAWCYPKVTKHSVNLMPTGTSHAAVVCHRRGSLEVAAVDETHAQTFVQELQRRAPWILVGYDKELARQWHANPGSVCQAVATRREQYDAGAQASPGSFTIHA